MMVDYISFCLFASFIITGLFLAAYDGGVLAFIRKPFDDANDALLTYSPVDDRPTMTAKQFLTFIVWIGKPIITCSKCMASVWGTLLYLYWFDSFVVVEWACIVLCISFFNALFTVIYFKI